MTETPTLDQTSSQPEEVDVAIIGGGIGGLAAAVALRHAGIVAHVYERTKVLGVVGGAIVIREPSVNLFRDWGVADRFERQAVRLTMIEDRNADGSPRRLVNAAAAGDDLTFSSHRADVHSMLFDALPQDTVHLGKSATAVSNDGESAVAQFADGSSVRARLVVGTDGIRSVVRTTVSSDEMIFANLVVLRGLAPATALPDGVRNDRINVWTREDQLMMMLPLSGGAEVALDTAVFASEPPDDLWNAEVPTEELLTYFEDFDPGLQQVIKAGTVPVKANPVYEREPLDHWSEGRITLLGDAAHPMAPRHGQGANSAIQDAGALARALSQAGLDDVLQALQVYQDERLPITAEIQVASRTDPDLEPIDPGQSIE